MNNNKKANTLIAYWLFSFKAHYGSKAALGFFNKY